MRSEFRQMAKRPKDFAFKTTSRKDLKKSTLQAQESRSWRRSQRLPVRLQASGGCDLGPSFFGCCSGERCPQPPAPGTSGDHREPPGPGRGGSQPPSQGQTPPVRSPLAPQQHFSAPRRQPGPLGRVSPLSEAPPGSSGRARPRGSRRHFPAAPQRGVSRPGCSLTGKEAVRSCPAQPGITQHSPARAAHRS